MNKTIVEIEVEGRPETETREIAADNFDAFVSAVRQHGAMPDAMIFERDEDEPIQKGVEAKKAISILVHRCTHVTVHVQYEHATHTKVFSPAATIFRVLQWAVGPKAFKLDDTARAKANLMLPGGTEPLPRDAVIGRYVTHPQCEITFDLTLKDFTNG